MRAGVSFSTGAQIMHTADCKQFSGELLVFSGNLKRPCFHTKTGAFAMLLRCLTGADYRLSLIAACAAARRAIGTRNGEQDT